VKKKKLDKQSGSNRNLLRGNPTWKKGTSANPKGRPRKEMCLTSLLKDAIDQKCPGDRKKRTWAQVINEKLLKKARKGDLQAMRLIYEYVEGKPKQEIEIPSEIKINVKFPEPKK
jgi:hypothetical protein